MMILDEKNEFDKTQFTMFKCLFRDFGLAFVNNFLEQLCLLIREKNEEKLEGSHRLAAEIITGMIRGSKYWTLEMLNKLWNNVTSILTECFLNLNVETRQSWHKCLEHSIVSCFFF
ncbi:unnamed protein product [Adineta steineri]|nr:unnamed protein product [Adineta steineri]